MASTRSIDTEGPRQDVSSSHSHEKKTLKDKLEGSKCYDRFAESTWFLEMYHITSFQHVISVEYSNSSCVLEEKRPFIVHKTTVVPSQLEAQSSKEITTASIK